MVEGREETRERGRDRDRERSEGEGDDEMRELQRTWAKQFFYTSPQPVRKATERERQHSEGGSRKSGEKGDTASSSCMESSHTPT